MTQPFTPHLVSLSSHAYPAQVHARALACPVVPTAAPRHRRLQCVRRSAAASRRWREGTDPALRGPPARDQGADARRKRAAGATP